MTLSKLNLLISTIQDFYIYGLISAYLQSSRLTYYCFMGAGRRQKISGSENKNFITHDSTNSMSIHMGIHSPLSQVPWRQHRGTQINIKNVGVLCYIGEKVSGGMKGWFMWERKSNWQWKVRKINSWMEYVSRTFKQEHKSWNFVVTLLVFCIDCLLRSVNYIYSMPYRYGG